jgi:O-antigen ligase
VPEHLRALAYLLVIAVPTLALAVHFLSDIVPRRELHAWALSWMTATIAGFLSGNFWIFLGIMALICAFMAKDGRNRLVTLMLLITAAPMPTVNNLLGTPIYFPTNYMTVIALVVLLPAVMQRPIDARRDGSLKMILFYAYMILVMAVNFRGTTATNALRSDLVMVIGIVIPFLAVIRLVNSHDDLRRAMIAYVFPFSALAAVGGFEMVNSWLLYSSVMDTWHAHLSGANYTLRENLLRASASFAAGGPIVFGYAILIAIGFALAFVGRGLSRAGAIAVLGALALGIAATYSRGPWLGAIVTVLVFLATGASTWRHLARFGVVGVLCLVVLVLTPLGPVILHQLPFVGADDPNTLYRIKLFNVSLGVINQFPLFGLSGYRDLPVMQQLIQGQGIIDFVNSYIKIALDTGYIGLMLFVGFFATVLRDLRRAVNRLPAERDDHRQTGRAIFATLAGALVTIATVSSVERIDVLYWILAGLAIGYTRVLNHEGARTREPVSNLNRRRAPAKQGVAARAAGSRLGGHRPEPPALGTKPIPR